MKFLLKFLLINTRCVKYTQIQIMQVNMVVLINLIATSFMCYNSQNNKNKFTWAL